MIGRLQLHFTMALITSVSLIQKRRSKMRQTRQRKILRCAVGDGSLSSTLLQVCPQKHDIHVHLSVEQNGSYDCLTQ